MEDFDAKFVREVKEISLEQHVLIRNGAYRLVSRKND